MSVEEVRKRLNVTIFRNRHRPCIEEKTAKTSLEGAILDDILVSEEFEKALTYGMCSGLREKEEILWERVKITLHDKMDPSQTDLNLILARRKVLPPPYRTVVLLHGTGKCSTTPEMIHRATRFILKDFMVVLLNSRYHGCRAGKGFEGKERYIAELVKAWRNNTNSGVESHCYPFIYDTSADLASLADYLLSRADVCEASLGIAGISLGGMHAWFASAADERWKAVAPLIGVQSFRYAIESECFQARVNTIQEVFDAAACDEEHGKVTADTVRAVWNRICPGLLEYFDAEFSLPLLFPRPVFVGTGELDPRCPIGGVREAVEMAHRICLKTWGDKGKLELHVYPGVAHEVTEEMWSDCVKFFDRVLPTTSISQDLLKTTDLSQDKVSQTCLDTRVVEPGRHTL